MSYTTQTLDALYSTGHWLLAQERHRDALSVFRTMLLVDARDERGWLGLATCHEKLEEMAKAIELCRLAVSACAPNAVRVAIARARMHRALGAHDDARDAYEEALALADAANEDELAAMISQEAPAS